MLNDPTRLIVYMLRKIKSVVGISRVARTALCGHRLHPRRRRPVGSYAADQSHYPSVATLSSRKAAKSNSRSVGKALVQLSGSPVKGCKKPSVEA